MPTSFTGARAMLTLALLSAACRPSAPGETDDTDEALIANAMSGGPRSIAQNAAIAMRTPTGEMRILRRGANGYTCMPDGARTPNNTPMCIDAPGLAWVQALRNHSEPPDGPVAVAYMLQGSAFPSFDDPFATPESAGGKWFTTGPILMIMNVRGKLAGYSAEGRDPSAPFIMFQGTPYEHLMIPVAAPVQ